MIELPRLQTRAPPPVVRDPGDVPPVSERDAITDAIINNNGFLAEYRSRLNIIEREYRRFVADADYVIVDRRVRYVPRATRSTRELVLRTFQGELARLLSRIVTLRNSDKLLPCFMENTTNRSEMDALMADLQALHDEIERDIQQEIGNGSGQGCSIS